MSLSFFIQQTMQVDIFNVKARRCFRHIVQHSSSVDSFTLFSTTIPIYFLIIGFDTHVHLRLTFWFIKFSSPVPISYKVKRRK